jgi:outer membrane protein TolC
MRRVYRAFLAAMAVLGVSTAALPAQEKAAPLNLDDCLKLAEEKQPALAAARASLMAAQDGSAALGNLPLYARLAARDLRIRKEQACLGVTIAGASLLQAEWETRYAVTRNYYSVTYVRMQLGLLSAVLKDLEKSKKRAEELLKLADPNFKVTAIDINQFNVNIALVKARRVEAVVGEKKAIAALREAIGVGPDYPLDIPASELPAPVASLDRDELIRMALANRGEITQATSAKTVVELEVEAQAKKWFGLKNGTFAQGADIHAQPIPQGVANGEYRPGAIGLEMPNMLFGKRQDRIARADAFSIRAGAVVDKAFNLASLETDNGYLKYVEARDRMEALLEAKKESVILKDRVWKRFNEGQATGGEYILASTTVDTIQGQYNEQLYMHALALAALERITAGGYRIYPK